MEDVSPVPNLFFKSCKGILRKRVRSGVLESREFIVLECVCLTVKRKSVGLFHAQTNTFARMAPQRFVLRYYFTILK